jgi:hypothetical protein
MLLGGGVAVAVATTASAPTGATAASAYTGATTASAVISAASVGKADGA